MTTFVTRAQWGARAPKGAGNVFGSILGTAVHWEAAAPPADHAQCDDAVRRIQAFHMDVRGWSDIAYNLIACDHDYLFEGRRGGTAANGTDYGNLHFPAVCWLGGPGHTPKEGALSAIATAHGRLGGTDKPIYPHSHFHPTQCPGDFLRAWIAAGAKAPGSKPPPPVLRHFTVTYPDSAGQSVTSPPKNRAELDTFAGNVIEHHHDDAAPYVYVVTYDPAPDA